ncbi:major capsid protein [Pseudomonas phage DDSR119]|nr:major capsid protein [Pseudomonas phage DDSR119]
MAVSSTLRINASAKVRNQDIKMIQHNGKDHWVIPSYTLPAGVVMNGGLYPGDEIDKAYKTLEGTLAPIGHPVVNSKAVKAGTAEAINSHYHGVWNKNVSKSKCGRIYIEKWVDIEFAGRTEEGRQLLGAIEAGLPIHTSTGLYCEKEPVTNGAAGYSWIARNMRFDHDAILFDEPGAATPDDGVGMMVNSAELVVNAVVPELTTNGVLKNSWGMKRDALNAALREVYGTNDNWVSVEDFDDTDVVFYSKEGVRMVSYEFDDGVPVLGSNITELVSRTEFVAKGTVVGTNLSLQKNSVESEPSTTITQPEKTPDMDPKELAAALKDALAVGLAPIQEALTATNQAVAKLQSEADARQEQLTANAKKADDELRTAIIAADPGLEMVANSLSGEPLELLAAKTAKAAPLGAGASMTTNSKDGVAAFDNVKGA